MKKGGRGGLYPGIDEVSGKGLWKGRTTLKGKRSTPETRKAKGFKRTPVGGSTTISLIEGGQQ